MQNQEVFFRDLSTIPYDAAWALQEKLLQESLAVKRQKSGSKDSDKDESALATRHYLLFCEHEPVFTLGKSGDPGHLLISETECIQRGIRYYPVNRGGDITFHGPGQLVGYPILDLERFTTDIGKYLRNLEEVIIRTLADFGISGERSPGETGVWLDPGKPGRERKICAMGVRCSRWVTMHGFALNVSTDLSYFDAIVPCGIRGKQVTSMQKELGTGPSMISVKDSLRGHFEEVFDCILISAGLSV